MSVVLQSSGGGQVTLQEPATASNFTLNLPAQNSTLATSADVTSAVGAVPVGGMSLLQTISPTGQNTLTFSGLSLSSYRQLYIVFKALSAGGSTTVNLVNFGVSSGVALAPSATATHGCVTIDLNSGIFTSLTGASAQSTVTSNTVNAASPTGASFLFGYSGIKNATTSISLYSGISTTNWTSGSVELYGVK